MSSRFARLMYRGIFLLAFLAQATAVPATHAFQLPETGQGIYVAAADGSGTTRIIEGGHDPAPSPDGSIIAYATYGPNGTGIMVAGWDGSGARQVVSVPTFPLMPSWSPDGSKIAFLTFSDGYNLVLHVVNADGSGLKELAPGTRTYPYRPAWLHDGRQIVFIGPGSGGSDLWLINVDGSGAVQITDLPGETEALALSPDGTLIAFSEQEYEGERRSWLYTVRPDGSELTTLAQWTANADPGPTNVAILSGRGPAWSPDGTQLAVPSIQGVALIQADGSGTQVLPIDEFAQVLDVVYSPNGTQLAMSYYSEFGDEQLEPGAAPPIDQYEDIYVMNIDGSGLMPVGETALVDLQPLWSPDGTKIVFANEETGE
jgi:Tol biopolymer transport system component